MVDDLGAAVAAVPETAHLCLYHSWVAAYLTPGRQRALAAAVAEVAGRRPVSWVFAESPRETPGLPMPPPPAEAEQGATALVVVDDEGAGPRPRRLGDLHHHGSWLRWYPPGP